MSAQILADIREWSIFLIDFGILFILIIEYRYDRDKDIAKSQRRTKTTKKTTTNKDGSNTVEESVEAVEPLDKPEK